MLTILYVIHFPIVYIVWQYRLWSFQGRDTELEKFVAKNQPTACRQMKLPNFDSWIIGELSKIKHHLESKVI